jgi:hypothetical protein
VASDGGGGARSDADARIAALEAALAEANARNAQLIEQVAKLSAQIEKLVEELRQNSTNSHRPPSSDGPAASSRTGSPRKEKPKSGRSRGGQKGHKGSHRELLPPDSVDVFIDLFPEVRLGRLMTVAHTARKQGKAVLDFIVRSVKAHLDGATPPKLLRATTET